MSYESGEVEARAAPVDGVEVLGERLEAPVDALVERLGLIPSTFSRVLTMVVRFAGLIERSRTRQSRRRPRSPRASSTATAPDPTAPAVVMGVDVDEPRCQHETVEFGDCRSARVGDVPGREDGVNAVAHDHHISGAPRRPSAIDDQLTPA